MSYNIYQTDGFVIDSIDVGEANKLLTLYTSELGLVNVAAQAVRVSQSKLRQSIQDLTFSSFALVRGKEVWRLTSARKLISLYDKRLPLGARQLMARTLLLVKRLVAGEARHKELYSILTTLSSFCFANRVLFMDKNDTESLRLITELRILAVLGYASAEADLSIYMNECDAWNVELVKQMSSNKENGEHARSEISRALRESHL